MITQHGPHCDVCNQHILLDKSINPFSVPGIAQELHCHDKCVDVVKDAFSAKDWRRLPNGRLREVFEQQEKVTPPGREG